MMTPAALTEKDAATYICMSAAWLKQTRHTGDLPNRTPAPCHIKIGRSVRYLVKDLDEWLEERRAS